MMNPERKRTAAILLWRSMLIISSLILLPFCFLQRPVHSPFPVPDGGQRLSGKTASGALGGFRKGGRRTKTKVRRRGRTPFRSLFYICRPTGDYRSGQRGLVSSIRHTGPFMKSGPSNFTNAGTSAVTIQA